MHPPNVDVVLSRLSPSDVVLDIGGWACPFNRANYVLDAEPYETRGYYGTIGQPANQGGDKEYFARETWIQRDICAHSPYPFSDKSIDFVICSHTLEDVRDPIWVCHEMVRIAKRGYLEFPSRLAESCRGWESPRIAGLSHHRWLIDVDPAIPALKFLMKYHIIHSHWKLSFPPSVLRKLKLEERISWLFWDESFAYSEVLIHGTQAIEEELETYVTKRRPYPKWMTITDRGVRGVCSRLSRLSRRVSTLARKRVDP